mmetsp:Transcript_81163/g.121978  ORF Transcript_81163/g.121978 Transcript_81163/m.121978 type:complete len:392 (+) Transcript_81163:42-1217(+)
MVRLDKKDDGGGRHHMGYILVIVILLGLLITEKTGYDLGNSSHETKQKKNKSTKKLKGKRQPESDKYKGSAVENYILNHAKELGYYNTDEGKFSEPSNRPDGCAIFKDPEVARPIYSVLNAFREELKNYQKRVKTFSMEDGVKDLRLHLDDKICDRLELHEDGFPGMFQIGVLSHGDSGYVEPILPPLRDPEFCFSGSKLMSLGHIVHDFAHMCRKLKRTSRVVFVDMGASLDFHAQVESPAMYITSLYQKFGFAFDHIYAFEVTQKKPEDVYKKVPTELMGSYHWINVGVSTGKEDKMNPWKLLLENFNEDDFVVVKLDIDTSSLEVPLAHQLLEDDDLGKLVDSFYFEHHVHLENLQRNWGRSMNGTLADSMKLFRGLREKGISAHYWP